MATSNSSQPVSGNGQSEHPSVARHVEQLLDLRRVGTVMAPERDRPEEAWGVLNPASARSRDGDLFLFPRLVAAGNYSRIGIASVTFDASGNPLGVERLGFALEPRENYEIVEPGVGGVEDPRITYIPALGCYVMTYTALGPSGARIALAASTDLRTWDRLGRLHFETTDGVDLNRCDNKDCVIFPLPVADPDGRLAFALLHRPIYSVPGADGTTEWMLPPGVADRRPSIWISYVPVDRAKHDPTALTRVSNHQVLAQPAGDWEHHHIGSGAPPILSEEGWLLYYHGVVGSEPAGAHATPGGFVYQSGVMLLDRGDPRRVLYRSSRPVLVPQGPGETEGIVSNVVFPTAVDIRGTRVDVYYGAADERIVAATTRIAASVLLGPSAPPDPHVLHHVASSTPGEEWRPHGLDASRVETAETQPAAGTVLEGAHPMQIKDIMTRIVEVVGPNTTLAEAAERMRWVDVGMLPVQDGDTVVGVLTDRDMTVRAVAKGLNPMTATVGQVLTPDVHYCFDDETIEVAASRMVESRLRRLIVLDRGERLVGIISLDDIAAGAQNPTLAGDTLAQVASRSSQVRGRYEKILVALDGSSRAERVLLSIEPLAQKFGSKIVLLRAVTPVPAPVKVEMGSGNLVVEAPPVTETVAAEEMRRDATTYLTGLQQRLQVDGFTVDIECPEGYASDVILHRARQLGADLIALTTHGRTGVDRLLLGSVAEDIVRQTHCPVHLVRVQSGP